MINNIIFQILLYFNILSFYNVNVSEVNNYGVNYQWINAINTFGNEFNKIFQKINPEYDISHSNISSKCEQRLRELMTDHNKQWTIKSMRPLSNQQ